MDISALADNSIILKLEEINKLGLNQNLVVEKIQMSRIKPISLNMRVRVSFDEEAESVKFETEDNTVIVVPMFSADGARNKWE